MTEKNLTKKKANSANVPVSKSVFGGRWISIEEKLPQKDETVLVFQPNNRKELECFVCGYDGSNFREFETHEPDKRYESLTWYDEITHWMQLPNPPKTVC